MRSACQIRTLYGLPCERCRYNDECSTFKNEQIKKGKEENEQKKQRKRSRRKDTSKQCEGDQG